MITQNPIIGHAKKKLGNIYARTQYGKNILQSCPPPTKGHQTKTQVAVCNAFGELSRLSNQISPSLLNNIYYSAPSGRSRRAQWMKDLSPGMQRDGLNWVFNPENIQILGGNQKVSEQAFILTPESTQVSFALSSLSAVGNAKTDEVPLLILICPSKNICIDLLSYTSIQDDQIILNPLSSTLVGNQCYIFPMWKVNVGTPSNPIYAYGRYEKAIV